MATAGVYSRESDQFFKMLKELNIDDLKYITSKLIEIWTTIVLLHILQANDRLDWPWAHGPLTVSFFLFIVELL